MSNVSTRRHISKGRLLYLYAPLCFLCIITLLILALTQFHLPVIQAKHTAGYLPPGVTSRNTPQPSLQEKQRSPLPLPTSTVASVVPPAQIIVSTPDSTQPGVYTPPSPTSTGTTNNVPTVPASTPTHSAPIIPTSTPTSNAPIVPTSTPTSNAPTVPTSTPTITQPCSLQISPTNLTFQAVQQQKNIQAQTIILTESGPCNAPITWTAQADTASAHWLMLAAHKATNTSTDNTLTVNIKAQGNKPGTYQGQITFSARDTNGINVNINTSVTVKFTILTRD
ncbi:MAG TPA: hypothetical protein VL485_15865 [Ktedonobacteraceae bacterium]|nr:hypothetical protein [Ktedonobacteraceae bacterium]